MSSFKEYQIEYLKSGIIKIGNLLHVINSIQDNKNSSGLILELS
ncbi:hypothetical protein CPJCM30710_19700 [Clostridium polyendosporum]|uniref:Uncharacterized protein n=1 Tax=Clostridium polyendosporum TaxID=69208 RepID=A0A919RZX2_9CLOT|nr:hypothetical protein CPJCM30710_19700 [Clostridium polyendosporum]